MSKFKYSDDELDINSVLKLNQDIISEEVFDEVLDVLLSKKNSIFQKFKSNILKFYSIEN